jgi:hypothetical protein
MVRAIENGFEVLERRQYGELGPTVIVFQPIGRQEREAGLRSARIH